MTDEKKITTNSAPAKRPVRGSASARPGTARPGGDGARSSFGAGGARFAGKRGGSRPPRRDQGPAEQEFDQKIVDLARVTRVMAGGKRMRFRACVAIGNHNGKVAVGLAKGVDVTAAITKAVNQAKKSMLTVPIANGTIPHQVLHKFGAARILIKPAPVGKGIICGGVVRIIAELAGIHNMTGKILGTGNNVANAKCVMEALALLRTPKAVAKKVAAVEAKTEEAPATPIVEVTEEDIAEEASKKSVSKKAPAKTEVADQVE